MSDNYMEDLIEEIGIEFRDQRENADSLLKEMNARLCSDTIQKEVN